MYASQLLDGRSPGTQQAAFGLGRRLAEHDRNRPRQQQKIRGKRPLAHVLVVEPHHLVERDVVAADNLPEARYAGPDVQPAPGPALDMLVLLRNQRAGPDKAHVAAENIDQLRQLVERMAAEEAADSGNARI